MKYFYYSLCTICVIEYYSEYECNTPLLERAVLTATSSMQGRGPENAILYGKNCYFAEELLISLILLDSLFNIIKLVTTLYHLGYEKCVICELY